MGNLYIPLFLPVHDLARYSAFWMQFISVGYQKGHKVTTVSCANGNVSGCVARPRRNNDEIHEFVESDTDVTTGNQKVIQSEPNSVASEFKIKPYKKQKIK